MGFSPNPLRSGRYDQEFCGPAAFLLPSPSREGPGMRLTKITQIPNDEI